MSDEGKRPPPPAPADPLLLPVPVQQLVPGGLRIGHTVYGDMFVQLVTRGLGRPLTDAELDRM